jgi:allantoin racemase
MLVQASRALAEKGAEVLVLGCAGLSGFRQELESKAKLPVIEPVEAACWSLRSLVELGLRTSRTGIFAKPSPKQLTGIDSILAKPLGEWLKTQTEKGFKNK